MNKEPELVDLGLPSGNLWMKCNLGASCETDPGFYYQLGSIIGHKGSGTEQYSSVNSFPIKRNKITGTFYLEDYYKLFHKNKHLRPEFDAVTQAYGKDYRIPTEKDLTELIDNTTWEWKVNYKYSLNNGTLLTSKINGNSIFIPLSGAYTGMGKHNENFTGYFLTTDLEEKGFLTCLYIEVHKLGKTRTSSYYASFPIRGIKEQ